MKRIILLVTVALVMAVMMAGPASATIHPIVQSSCSAPQAEGTPAQTMDPPGISGQSNASNYARPLVAIAFGPQGFEGGGNALNAVSGEGTTNCTFAPPPHEHE